MKKIVILIGNYCSGKTEIAMNMAMLSASQGKRTQVIDLDRINDYFRMSDHIQMLIDKCINVVSPSFVGKGLTQTVMPAQVASAFDSDWDLVIFDVGGDQAGALSLARYHQDFAALEPGQLEVYDIVNVFRPMSESPEKIIKLKGELEGFARQTVTGFVNNSNLLNYASADDLRQGYDILRETSDLTGIPIVHTTGRKKFLDEFLADGRDPKYIGTPLALETYMHRSWDAFSHGKI
ncbi:MAG: hypothetical protein ACLUGA_02150 [Oscillospiraceae bacterium]|jgi:hypothetical protein|nr:hypothetical protein [Bacillota bacterium]MEE0794612.1 hypothetical protein [Oscillospiraceae bacterium]